MRITCVAFTALLVMALPACGDDSDGDGSGGETVDVTTELDVQAADGGAEDASGDGDLAQLPDTEVGEGGGDAPGSEEVTEDAGGPDDGEAGEDAPMDASDGADAAPDATVSLDVVVDAMDPPDAGANTPDAVDASDDSDEKSPCEECLASGGTWQPEANACTQNCDIQDISCYTSSCPEPCSSGSCGTCFGQEACEAAGCTWNAQGPAMWCSG